MLRFILTRWARFAYIAKLEREAGLHIAMGKVQAKKGALERKQAEDQKKDADSREARIKEMAEMEEKGYWICPNGHEEALNSKEDQRYYGQPIHCKCGSEAKFISRATMSGQEQYESDKERKESEKMLANLRAEISAHEGQAEMHEKAAEYFANRAQSARTEADEVRRA